MIEIVCQTRLKMGWKRLLWAELLGKLIRLVVDFHRQVEFHHLPIRVDVKVILTERRDER